MEKESWIVKNALFPYLVTARELPVKTIENARFRAGGAPLWSVRPDTDDGEKCPVRNVLDRIGDAWSLLVILNLRDGPNRFNALKRSIGDISQRMLAVTLRHLERDGLVSRKVLPTNPPQVEYALTKLGHSLVEPIDTLALWAIDNHDTIRTARKAYDAKLAQA
jgi:DNA-binding HxlR family transcriptional regulator